MALVALAALFAAGCAGNDPSPAPAGPSPTDPCIEQMHDLCGVLLLYWLREGRLPPDRAALRAAAEAKGLSLVCPVSKEPYLYDPNGIAELASLDNVVLADSTPCHAGGYFAVKVSLDPAGGVPSATPIFLRRPE